MLNALHLGIVSSDEALDALENFVEYEAATAEFIEPFVTAFAKEQVGLVSEFVKEAQVLIYFLLI